ncbi:MAG: c-type cytochrome [Rhodoferax sp.]
MNKFFLTLSALLVASVTTFSVSAQELAGDIRNGERRSAMCIGCHGIVGYHASFPEVYQVPKISGQGAKYIASALGAYKRGERKHPTMRGIADSLSVQDIADLSAYYAASGVVEGAPKPGKAADGSARAMALVAKAGCVSCHGDSFSKPIDPSFPKIAGQHSDYLYYALKAYKTENNAMVGRGNPVMGGIAKQFSNSELRELANYVGSLPGELKTVSESRFR